VAAHVSDPALQTLHTHARRVVRIGDGRYQAELPLDPPPDRVLSDLTAAGAALVSLNPIRQTLEEFFVQEVTAPTVVAADRGLGAHRPEAKAS
jgi:hypothetical protein